MFVLGQYLSDSQLFYIILLASVLVLPKDDDAETVMIMGLGADCRKFPEGNRFFSLPLNPLLGSIYLHSTVICLRNSRTIAFNKTVIPPPLTANNWQV